MLAEPKATALVRHPEDAYTVLGPMLHGREVECLAVLALDRRNRALESAILTVGCDDHTIVEPRTILRWALRTRLPCRAIVVAHNHPSGDPTPSREDIEVTARLAQACAVVGISLLDHLVVTDDGFRSLADLGALPELDRSPSYT